MADGDSMNGVQEPPRFFTIEFHVHFFPRLLRGLLRRRKEGYQSPFADHLPLEYIITLALCVMAVAVGLPTALKSRSLWGWLLFIVGMAGFVFLFAGSVRSAMGRRPTYDAFRPAIFFFFVLLGGTIGLLVGAVEHSPSLQFWGGFWGLLAGYGLGIFVGLWVQVLGWIGRTLDVLALGGIAGLVVMDLLLLI